MVLGCASYAQGCAQTKWQGSKWKSSYSENHTNLWIVCYCNIVIHLNINTITIYHHHYRYHRYPHHHCHHHNHVLPVSRRQSPCTLESATCLYQVHKWRDRFQPVWPANHWTIDPEQIVTKKQTIYSRRTLSLGHPRWGKNNSHTQKKKKQQLITWSQMWIYKYRQIAICF